MASRNIKAGCQSGCGAVFRITRTWIREAELYAGADPDGQAKRLETALRDVLETTGHQPHTDGAMWLLAAIDTRSVTGLRCPVCGGLAAEGDPAPMRPPEHVRAALRERFKLGPTPELDAHNAATAARNAREVGR